MRLRSRSNKKSISWNAVTIDDSAGAFDASGNSMSLDNSLVTAARTTLDAEAAATLNTKQIEQLNGSTDTYAISIGDQLRYVV